MAVNVSEKNTMWKPPKTDWTAKDRFNIEDYNRIKNNLAYLYELAVSIWKYFPAEDMGEDITSYEAYWDVDVFNAFEKNLEEINKNTWAKNIGQKQTFYENGIFIKWDELNRIESATLSMHDMLIEHKKNIPRLDFRLGCYRAIKA